MPEDEANRIFNLPIFNLPIFNLPIFNLPIFNLPIFNLPIFNLPIFNLPIFNLPIFNLPIFNLPIFNLPIAYSHSFHTRNTSATLHACQGQPRGVKGASPSAISLMLPRPASFRWCRKGSRKARACARFW